MLLLSLFHVNIIEISPSELQLQQWNVSTVWPCPVFNPLTSRSWHHLDVTAFQAVLGVFKTASLTSNVSDNDYEINSILDQPIHTETVGPVVTLPIIRMTMNVE